MTGNLSRYQKCQASHVGVHVNIYAEKENILTAAVVEIPRILWPQASPFHGPPPTTVLPLISVASPCCCLFALEVERGGLDFSSVSFSSQELKSHGLLVQNKCFSSSIWLRAGGTSECSSSNYQSCGVTSKHSLTSRFKRFAPLAWRFAHRGYVKTFFFFIIRGGQGTRRRVYQLVAH